MKKLRLLLKFIIKFLSVLYLVFTFILALSLIIGYPLIDLYNGTLGLHLLVLLFIILSLRMRLYTTETSLIDTMSRLTITSVERNSYKKELDNIKENEEKEDN